MARAKKGEAKGFTIKVKNRPDYCGIGAGGVQFANGQAVIPAGRMVDWFSEHDGYEVIANEEAAEDETKAE